ncbi:MAG: patatin-like phospholipase family protein [Planctomycetes bacterium]|nr:patatin-like phospholipase family protein [Planctomycetota bacterium]
MGTALLGGGARAAYQVGVLALIADRLPRLPLPLIAGVSAGAANAMGLAGGEQLGDAVANLRESWRRLDPTEIFDMFPSGRGYSILGLLRECIRQAHDSHGTFKGLFDDRPIRRFVSRCASLTGVEENLVSGRLTAVALTASSYDTGKSVTFFQGLPSLAGWTRDHGIGVAASLTMDHIMASGALPLLFSPVRIGDGLYGDGNVRQQYPLSPLIRLGAERILVIDPGPSRQSVPSPGPARGSIAETFGILLDSMVVDRIEADLSRIREINHALAAGPGSSEMLNRRLIDLLVIRPTIDVGTLAASLGPPRCRMLRLAARAAGGWNERVAGLLSYLWVDPRFTDRLYDLGYADARTRWEEMEFFLTRPSRISVPDSRAAG